MMLVCDLRAVVVFGDSMVVWCREPYLANVVMIIVQQQEKRMREKLEIFTFNFE